MSLTPEQHHEDCDFRLSSAAKETAETFGVDVEENSEVFDCNLGCADDVREVGDRVGWSWSWSDGGQDDGRYTVVDRGGANHVIENQHGRRFNAKANQLWSLEENA